jgi:putative oxidoreductase
MSVDNRPDRSLNQIAWVMLAVPLRLALGGIFLAAAWFKLRPPKNALAMSGPQDFSNAIKAFKLDLPDAMVRFTTSAVPWTEAICAILLILGFWTRAAAALIALMTTLFTALVASAVMRKLNIECGCFGDRGLICTGPVGWCKVLENGLLIAAALALMLTRTHAISVDGLRSGRLDD